MKIGIDCRMYGLQHAGIGRYVENLVEEVLKQDEENEYVLFVRKSFDENQKSKVKSQKYNSKFKIIITDFPHYSLKEQLLFPSIIYKEKVDLMHFPHFNVPVIYFGKYIVTIHDLIKHTSKGVETTTRSHWIYWLKYLGYKITFWLAVKKAIKIIVPSKYVKNELTKEYNLKSEKVMVTYEGVDDKLKDKSLMGDKEKLNADEILEKYQIKKPFLLYVGSVYPHKNIDRLIEAVKILKANLVIACARSIFWERLKKKIQEMKAEEFVRLAGFVPDEELAVLYKQTQTYVFPSLSEGFGLPGLEAMAAGASVVASDIPVLKEIYGNAAEYFNPLDPEDMAKKINEVITNEKMRNNLVRKGLERVKDFSWQKMASQTLQIYNSVL